MYFLCVLRCNSGCSWLYSPVGLGGLSPYKGGGGTAHLFVTQKSQYQKTGCLMFICCAVCRTPLGRRGGLPRFHFRHGGRRGDTGSRTTCDCTFSVLLHIALCVCYILCMSVWRGILPHMPPWAQSFHSTQRQNILRNAICRYSGLFTPLLVGVRCQGGVPDLPRNAMRGNFHNGPRRWCLWYRILFLPPWLLTGCIHETAWGASEAH